MNKFSKIFHRPINSKMAPGQILHGWINLDKPPEMTSTQALGRVKHILGVKKAGHAGTLDPLATGCLPLALGEATKTIQYAQDHLKTYHFEVTWGTATTTDDLQGEIKNKSDKRPDKDHITDTLASYTGPIHQTPPQFSAIKIKGKRAYDMARKGEVAAIKPRQVFIKSLELLTWQKNKATFQAICGKGVYIRSLARDMGEDLGCYGHISSLRRTQVGPFDEKNMITLDNLEKIVHSGDLHSAVYPAETMLDDIPAIEFSAQEAARMKNGQRLGFYNNPDVKRLENAGIDVTSKSISKAYATLNGTIFALLEVERCKIKPERILNI